MTSRKTQFALLSPHQKKLRQSAYLALHDAFDLQPEEKILIIANPEEGLPEIGQAFYNAALEFRAHPVLLFQSARNGVDMAESSTLSALASEPDVIITVTQENLGKDYYGLKNPYKYRNNTYNHIFHYLVASGKSRAAWCPCMTTDMFLRTVAIDYSLLWKRAKQLKRVFDEAVAIKVITPAGTDLHIDTHERKGMLDDGDYRRPGSGGNLPAGEVFCIPGALSSGKAVIDGSASLVEGTLIAQKPFTLIFEEGKLIAVEGGDEAQVFKRTLVQMRIAIDKQRQQGVLSLEQAELFLDNYLNLAEFGLGLNPAATIQGNMTEDEKVMNTCHIAIGDDCYGFAPSIAHLDLIMYEPHLTITSPSGQTRTIDPIKFCE